MKPKRLTRLKISEVSAVPHGAGEGVRIMLAKRVTGFDDAGELLINGVPRWRLKSGVTKVDRSDSLAKALDEIEENRAVAKAAAQVTGDQTMQIETTDVAKAAQAIVKRFDDRVAEIVKRHDISRNAALLKIATSPEDAALWRSYREAQQLIAPPTPTHAPAPLATSAAYDEMMAKAEKRAAKHGTSVATEFSKLYQARPDLAQQDKQHFFDKAGAGIDPNELLIVAIQNALGCDRARAAGLALEVRSKNPDPSLLHVTTRDAA